MPRRATNKPRAKRKTDMFTVLDDDYQCCCGQTFTTEAKARAEAESHAKDNTSYGGDSIYYVAKLVGKAVGVADPSVSYTAL